MNVMKLMLVALAGWINQQKEVMIDYLQEEVKELKNIGAEWKETPSP